MKIEIRILSGALADTIHAYEPAHISVGRGPEAGLRFDATGDPFVSTRHALLYYDAGRWWVQDLKSQNGTYHNGRRIDGPTALSNGDRITFGRGGPEVQVRIPGQARRRGAGTTAVAATGAARLARRWRDAGWAVPTAAAAIGALLVVIFYLANLRQQEQAEWDRERAVLLSRIDSLLLAGASAVRALDGEREEVAQALRGTQDELRVARADLEQAMVSGDDGRIDELRRELQARTAALERHQLAASLDFDAIERGSRRALAVVYVETQSGELVTGTGFAVSADGTFITAGHLVLDERGEPLARRIGIQFADSDQVFPAGVLAAESTPDLAVLGVRVGSAVPVVQGFSVRSDTLGAGAPVAVIGFPLGGTPGGLDGPAGVARPLVSAGVIVAWRQDYVEIQGYGAEGASGSPIFDADGHVIAVLFGGRDGPDGRRIFGVPARQAVQLLVRRP